MLRASHAAERTTSPAGTGVPAPSCRVCGRSVVRPSAVCFCCRLVARQLGLPLVPTVVVADYRLGDRRHAGLRGYKDAPTAALRERFRQEVTDVLAAWLEANAVTLAGRLGGWAVVTPVPSTRREGPAPAGGLLDGVPALADVRLDLLDRGTARADHLHARRDGFRLLAGVDRAGLDGLPVLVFDDSVTTGARSQSAAAALRLGGARVVGVLAVGRALPAA